MMRRSLRLILPLFAALGVACGSDGNGGFEPEPPGPEPPEPEPPVFSRLEVMPTAFALFTVAPGNTFELTVLAYDRTGATLPLTSAPAYSSSAPAIAEVSSSGVVTAAATVKVYAGDYADIPGVYDLTALITTFDPAPGVDLEGYRYTAVLTLEELRPPWIGGTYADVRLIGPSGDTTAVADTGFVYTGIDPDGRLLIVLVRDWDRTDGTLIPATLAPG